MRGIGPGALNDPSPLFRPEEEKPVSLDGATEVIAKIVISGLGSRRAGDLLSSERVRLVEGEKVPRVKLIVAKVFEGVSVNLVGS